MENKKILSRGIEKHPLLNVLFWGLMLLWVIIVGIHLVIASDFFTRSIIRPENKVVLFSVIAFSYTMFYYLKDLIRQS